MEIYDAIKNELTTLLILNFDEKMFVSIICLLETLNVIIPCFLIG